MASQAIDGRRSRAILAQRLREQQASGQGVREVCQGAGLSVPSFYWWRREVRMRDARRGADRPQFVSIRTTPGPAPVSAIEVVLAGGRLVRVETGCDADHLRAVMAALEAVPC